jgi:hypothetical protein
VTEAALPLNRAASVLVDATRDDTNGRPRLTKRLTIHRSQPQTRGRVCRRPVMTERSLDSPFRAHETRHAEATWGAAQEGVVATSRLEGGSFE